MKKQLYLCIKTATHPLVNLGYVEGRVYTLRDRYACPCGQAWLAFEEVPDGRAPFFYIVACAKCDKPIDPAMVAWGYYKHFIPLNDPDFVENTRKPVVVTITSPKSFDRDEVRRLLEEINKLTRDASTCDTISR